MYLESPGFLVVGIEEAWSRGLQGKGRAGEAPAGTGSPGNPLFSLFVPKATGCATRALEVSLLWGLTFNF